MGANEVMGEARKHLVELVGRHGDVSAKRGEDILEVVLIVIVGLDGEEAGPRVEASEVGWNGENILACAKLIEGFAESGTEIVVGEVGGW